MSSTPAQARAALARFDRRQQKRFASLDTRLAQALAREILVGVPRVTGGLAATLRVEGSTVSIGGGGIDAGAVEYGSSRQAPRPFFRPAVTRFVPTARAAARLSLR